MRKKICSKCGAIVNGNEKCTCRPTIVIKQNNFSKPNDIIHTKEWRVKRKQILERDNFLCQRCLIKYNILNSSQLTVHHIKSRKNYPELSFEDSNLMCLCDTCNKQLGTKDKLDFEWSTNNIEVYRDFTL